MGDHIIVRPAGAQPSPPCLYILGFNGGETELVSPKTSRPDRPTRSATVWFNLCQRAANVLGVDAYIITERCHWGSTNVGVLRARIGSEAAMRHMLRLHAAANLAKFRELPARVVWVTGLSTFFHETVEDYGLSEAEPNQLREAPLKGVLWRHFRARDDVPFLFTRHPTGARMARHEKERIFAKIAELARV